MPQQEVELWHHGELERTIRVENPRSYILNFNRSDFARQHGWEATQRSLPLPSVVIDQKQQMSLEEFADWLFEEHDINIDIVPPGQISQTEIDTKH